MEAVIRKWILFQGKLGYSGNFFGFSSMTFASLTRLLYSISRQGSSCCFALQAIDEERQLTELGVNWNGRVYFAVRFIKDLYVVFRNSFVMLHLVSREESREENRTRQLKEVIVQVRTKSGGEGNTFLYFTVVQQSF